MGPFPKSFIIDRVFELTFFCVCVCVCVCEFALQDGTGYDDVCSRPGFISDVTDGKANALARQR
jgi:hypothetical protein